MLRSFGTKLALGIFILHGAILEAASGGYQIRFCADKVRQSVRRPTLTAASNAMAFQIEKSWALDRVKAHRDILALVLETDEFLRNHFLSWRALVQIASRIDGAAPVLKVWSDKGKDWKDPIEKLQALAKGLRQERFDDLVSYAFLSPKPQIREVVPFLEEALMDSQSSLAAVGAVRLLGAEGPADLRRALLDQWPRWINRIEAELEGLVDETQREIFESTLRAFSEATRAYLTNYRQNLRDALEACAHDKKTSADLRLEILSALQADAVPLPLPKIEAALLSNSVARKEIEWKEIHRSSDPSRRHLLDPLRIEEPILYGALMGIDPENAAIAREIGSLKLRILQWAVRYPTAMQWTPAEKLLENAAQRTSVLEGELLAHENQIQKAQGRPSSLTKVVMYMLEDDYAALDQWIRRQEAPFELRDVRGRNILDLSKSMSEAVQRQVEDARRKYSQKGS